MTTWLIPAFQTASVSSLKILHRVALFILLPLIVSIMHRIKCETLSCSRIYDESYSKPKIFLAKGVVRGGCWGQIVLSQSSKHELDRKERK